MASMYEEVYQRSMRDPEGFWAAAAEDIYWDRRWDKVFDDSRPPYYRWFTGGRLNTCFNALDLHIEHHRWPPRRGKAPAQLDPHARARVAARPGPAPKSTARRRPATALVIRPAIRSESAPPAARSRSRPWSSAWRSPEPGRRSGA